jgi:hypothetical protein
VTGAPTGQPPTFRVRALEFHSSRMWQWAQVNQALDFMQRFQMNALVFHQNDIVDHLVFPLAFFPDALMWKRWPVRLHSVYQNRHYINKVAREAKARGIAFYLQIKEIWFVNELLEQVPGLRGPQGAICASDPFWWRFLDIKMRELLQAVPDLAGIIVSPGTRESKVSISANACTCARCQATDPTDWYTNLLRALHTPLAEQGRLLAVRDFSYSADQQSRMLEAARRVSGDIVISLKNTPHDYYPPFPHNPRIGHTAGLRQWIEYDTWGQFFGLGFFPVSVVEDMQMRMRHALDSGAEGISLRTDWEVITDASAFNSPNVLNAIAGAMLGANLATPLAAIYAAWAQHGLFSPLKTGSQMQTVQAVDGEPAAQALADFMKASWRVMEQAAYVRGHIFHEDDQYPETLVKAMDMLVHIHGRDDWEPGASRLLDPTDENLSIIFAEKARALSEAQALPAFIDRAASGISTGLAADLRLIVDLYILWVRGFALCAAGVFQTLRVQQTGNSLDTAAARKATEDLRAFGADVRQRLAGTTYPHHVYWLLDVTRTDSLAQDLLVHLDAKEQESKA